MPTFADALPRLGPPWLQRSVAGRLMRGFGQILDDVVDRATFGVALRFPTDFVDPDALALIGRERRIRRGPNESAVTYARRLRPWWDMHRIRGGPYALLRECRAYIKAVADVAIDVVYYSGTRRWIDTNEMITRDSIVWGADGSGLWARIWIFLHFAAQITTTGGELLTDDLGHTLLIGLADPSDLEVLTAIPREWNAAHVQHTTVVVLSGLRRLWSYPQPVPTWADWGASGATWGSPPTIATIEA